jgi:hypothetical protein
LRPKLEIDKMYYLKMKDVFIPGIYYGRTQQDGTFENHEYLVKVFSLERLNPQTGKAEQFPFGCLQVGLQILAATQSPDPSEQWRPGDDCARGWVRYVNVDQKFQKDRLVLMKLNRKRLPLYVEWPYGKEFITQLLQEAT